MSEGSPPEQVTKNLFGHFLSMNKYKSLVKFLWQYLKTAQHMRVIRYLMVGFGNMFVCFAFMYMGALIGLNYLEYTVLGYIVAILFSFYMNLRFTFRVTGNIMQRMIWFFIISFTNLAIVELIEYEMISVYHFNHLFSILCAMFWYAASGFTINALWVYRH